MDSTWIVSLDEPVLVTGAGGFIGSKVVKTLLDYGFRNVRCLVRSSSNIAKLEAALGPEAARSIHVVEGNLLAPEDCARAAAGAAVAFHLAAGMGRSFETSLADSVMATRNLLEAVRASGSLKRFVNVSSFAVYSNLEMRAGALLDENTPLETDSVRRHDPYGWGKLEQERLVQQSQHEFGIPYVILRPGAVYGPGQVALSGRIGLDRRWIFLHLGGSNRIPLTYVDNCAEAIVRAGIVRGVDNQVFNVVDDELPTSRQFLRLYKRHVARFVSIPVPYPVTYLLCWLWEGSSGWSKGRLPPVFNRRRCSAEWKGNRYSNQKLKEMLGWTPRVPFTQASKQFFDFVREARSRQGVRAAS